MTKEDSGLWKRRYQAVFKLMQDLADAGRILLDQYECSTALGEDEPAWMIILGRAEPDEIEYALKKLIKHTKEVNDRYGDPDPDGKNLD